MKPQIIPAILTNRREDALRKLCVIDGVVTWVQLDVTDGTFVPGKSWFDAGELKKYHPKFSLELHLMVQDPEPIIKKFLNVKYFKRAIWHIEAPVDHRKLIDLCRKKKIETGLALAPETPAGAVEPYADDIDEVLILGVHPGKSGQKILPASVKKISAVRKIAPKLTIGFDGGITDKNWKALAGKGVNRLCLASAVWKHKDPVKFLRSLREAFTDY